MPRWVSIDEASELPKVFRDAEIRRWRKAFALKSEELGRKNALIRALRLKDCGKTSQEDEEQAGHA